MSDVPALTPVPSGETRGWTLEVDGRELDCGTMSLSSSWGVLSYGRHPRGYDTWWFAERGGGGSITLPFCYVDEVLYVGLIEEDRPNMGGPVLCAIGGFLDPGDDTLAPPNASSGRSRVFADR